MSTHDGQSHEVISFLGTIFASLAYGVVLALFLMTLSRTSYPPQSWKNGALTLWLFSLATICIGLEIRWAVVVFIFNNDYPGGPNAYIEQNVGNWVYVLLNAVYVVLTWSTDIVVIHRFYVIYRCCWLSSLLPATVFLATLVTGSISLRQLTTQGATQSADEVADWAIIYRTLSLSLSVILTGLIVGRIIYYRRRSAFSSSSSMLISVAAMLIESASLETTTALVYIICVGVGSPLQNIFLPVLSQVQAISPLLIVYRVTLGRAWRAGSEHKLSHDLPFHAPALQISTSGLNYNLPDVTKTSVSSVSLSPPPIPPPSYCSTPLTPDAQVLIDKSGKYIWWR